MDWDYYILLSKKQNRTMAQGLMKGEFTALLAALCSAFVNLVLRSYGTNRGAALGIINAFADTAKGLVIEHFSENGGTHDEPSDV